MVPPTATHLRTALSILLLIASVITWLPSPTCVLLCAAACALLSLHCVAVVVLRGLCMRVGMVKPLGGFPPPGAYGAEGPMPMGGRMQGEGRGVLQLGTAGSGPEGSALRAGLKAEPSEKPCKACRFAQGLRVCFEKKSALSGASVG